MNEQIVAILHKCIDGVTLTGIEQKQLNDWLSQSHHNRKLFDEINSEAFHQDVKKELGKNNEAIWKKFQKMGFQQSKKNLIPGFRSSTLRYMAAAVLLILISTTAYIIFFVKPISHDQKAVSGTPPSVTHDVSPGAEKAILTLDNGTTLVLDSTSNGKIAEQGNTIIVKEDGLLAYNTNGKAPSNGVFYNTLTAPKGGTYSSLVLADGSKVWVNALSSIRFPTAFTGKDRVVEVTGEVYFEVAKNAAKPFIVNVKDKDLKVEVLGTHFNINSYDDEDAIKTTLLEGSVKVVARGKVNFLKPGQQAVLRQEVPREARDDKEAEIKVVNDADVEEAVAWKNGTFSFNKANLETIMRQVSRWYGVDVVFENNIPEHFVATGVPRNVPVAKLLKIFETAGGVKFEIDEAQKKIIVRR